MKKIEIKKITYEQAKEIWASNTPGHEDYKPLGLFYFIVRDSEKLKFIGIDNSTGGAWTEEFKSFTKCRIWLLGRRNGGW